MTLDDLRRLLAPVHTRIMNLVGRAVVKTVDDGKKLQELQVSVLAGEVRDEVEHFQPYGFTSVPRSGAEAVVLFVGGNREHGIAAVVSDRRYRLKDLQPGEVAVYNDAGAKIVLRDDGDIEATPKAGGKFRVSGDVAVTGSLETGGDVNVSGSVEATGDVKAGAISLQTHTHNASLTVSGSAGMVPVTGTATGSTGTPS